MGKMRTFKVINNRIQFICPACKAKKFAAVPRNLRRRTIRCTKCAEITCCILDRRVKPREQQSGKILMVTGERKLEVFLHDISMNGIGIDLPVKALRSGKLTTGRQVSFKCSWNPRLANGNFIVNNIDGQRLGVEKTGQ